MRSYAAISSDSKYDQCLQRPGKREGIRVIDCCKQIDYKIKRNLGNYIIAIGRNNGANTRRASWFSSSKESFIDGSEILLLSKLDVR